MSSNLEKNLQKLEHDPDNLDLLCEIGKGFKQRANFDCAMEYFNKALTINPDYSPATCCIINLYIDFGHYSDAFKFFNRAIEFHYNDEHFKATLFNALFAQFLLYRFSNQKDKFNTKHNFEELYFRMGSIYKNEGLFEPALKIFEVAYELSSSNTRLMLELSDCYIKLGKNIDAENILLKLKDKYPDDIDILCKLTELYSGLNEYKLSIENATKILSINPDEEEAQNLLAYSYAKSGNLTGAVEIYNQLTSNSKKKLLAYRNLYILYKLIENDEQQNQIEQYLKENHPNIIEVIQSEIKENVNQLETLIDK